MQGVTTGNATFNVSATPPSRRIEASLGRRNAFGAATASLLVGALHLNPPPADALGFTKELRPKRSQLYVPEEAFVDVGNGLKVADFRDGTGAKVKNGDQAAVHIDLRYRTLTVYSTRQGRGVTGGSPLGFEVGRFGGPGGVFIKGIDLGIVGMRVGGQRRLIIPSELAYGNKQMQEIPPGATITVDLELLSLKDNYKRGRG